jgi:hypothetical protein
MLSLATRLSSLLAEDKAAMLHFQLFRPTLIAFFLLVFAIPAACGTLQLGVENGNTDADRDTGDQAAAETSEVIALDGFRPEARETQASQVVTAPPKATVQPPATAAPPVRETPAVQVCENDPFFEGEQLLPELSDLGWVAEHSEIGALYRLGGLHIVSATPSPDGHWFAVKVVRRFEEMGEAETALYILDTSGEGHWLASPSGRKGWNGAIWAHQSRSRKSGQQPRT